MKIFSAYQKGFSQAIRHKRMIGVIYLVHLLLAFSLALQAGRVIDAAIGHSLTAHKLLSGYDHTVLYDMLRTHGGQIAGISAQLGPLIAVYLLISICLRGGILAVLRHPPDRFRMRTFWEGCWEYAGRFIRLNFVVWILELGTVSLVAFSTVAIITQSIGPGFTDRSIFWLAFASILITFFLIAFLLTVSQYAHAQMIHRNSYRVIASIREAIQLVRLHPGKTIGLFLLNIGTILLLYGLYFLLEPLIGMHSGWGVLIMFVLQQVFIFTRLLARIVNWASMLRMHGFLEKQALESPLEV